MLNELNLSPASAQQVATFVKEGVVTVQMNRPDKLNGWTQEMMSAFKEAFEKACQADSIKVIIFTGSGKYYSAGANLAGTVQVMHPKTLHQMIVEANQALFATFLDCPKPILAAVNGPALGASVTSAALCQSIIAATQATFSTPFKALGITPEGCSTVQFPRLMGDVNAERMLGEEGWKPTAAEALEAGLVQWVVPDDQLLDKAHEIAQHWIASGETKKFLKDSQLEELRAANARESAALADAFLGADFLRGQGQFLWKKKKHAPAAVFYSLWALRPLWGRLL
ncbi:MAG: enoyl-CoA hydratase/isomerase family protein [Pseudomonadota bacterium]|nr:enoyl-CoA hydratase/isomerase family protein [Pseudomonadota bacterium]